MKGMKKIESKIEIVTILSDIALLLDVASYNHYLILTFPITKKILQ